MQRDDKPGPDAGQEALRGRGTGPRHAAPRRSLLTRVQLPAGRAIALAAMPSALLFGMGLTPKLALADEPVNPFAPGPCVTQPDEGSQPEPEQPEQPEQETGEGRDGDGRDGGAEEPEAGEQPAEPEPTPEPTEPAPEPTPEPEPQPEPEPEPEPENPWDPLGLGDALEDLFTGGDKGSTAPQGGSEAVVEPRQETVAQPAAEPEGTDAVAGIVDDTVERADEAVDETERAIRDAAEQAGADVEELPEDVTDGVTREPQPQPDADGKQPFPCPTHDPEALANAELEQGIPLLPDEPWRLESSKLVLRGLDYHGIVEVRTAGGKVKKALKFTADTVDIGDLHQLVVGPQGTTSHVRAESGSTSTFRGGTVTMYTEELKGNLFGLIPVTFSPETPPPLNVPYAVFTDVHVTQAAQFGGTLTIPGMRLYSD
ncbi:hypothetical protein [Streptomyces sp. JJ38]|uniref:hypothetical protein n=1 Tax=Streptomyces sp. JJ38 TaxID=2738128 RepID=UPI0027DFA8BC|nr:hypothetical protein [Streptomyces sp. JJ38]MBW1595839.1 hypothetical protein [Streptomyces sp. JJ38]